ncbi:MAG: excinuclease ABC subunit UvrA [Candidatus Omnitrophica bacterium]|nr:excinuclease ABC subunit UvrA [Candidatus Omnitrophota bacterium]
MADTIVIRGAREHNLKGIDLALPRNALIVITGLSGSGKSSLAFDTLYAEGQRRYVESLSAYARQFLEQLQKPNVEHIDGLSPAIAIEQRTAGANPRSTVATQTEIYDYLRLLYARAGTAHCPTCRRPIHPQSPQEIVEQVLKLPATSPILVLAPVVRGRKGEYVELFKLLQREGFVRVRVDGAPRELSRPIPLDKKRAHSIDVVVDRLTIAPGVKGRLTDSLETALKAGKGTVVIAHGANDLVFSERYGCPACGVSFAELEPRLFSFNSPYGACPTCHGLGTTLKMDEALVIPDPGKSLLEGAVEPWRRGNRGYIMYHRALLRELAAGLRVSLETPFARLPDRVQRIILRGSDEVEVWGKPFEGVIPNLERLFRDSDSDFVKEEVTKYMATLPCPTCRGARLKSEALAVTVDGRSIIEATALSITQAYEWIRGLSPAPPGTVPRPGTVPGAVAEPILKEIRQRLQFLKDVGLEYLTLDRVSNTLSGGEAQRIRLATQIGAGLVGVLYILDEPSIGLHQRDNHKLLATLKALRDLGNTVIVVEHDEATIRAADYVVDLGPGAGKHGGEVVAAGPIEAILACERSLTGQYLRGVRQIAVPAARRPWRDRPAIEIRGAREHNLKRVTARIPLGILTCVTGVSGSGKSSLVDDILYRALAQRLYRARVKPGAYDRLIGVEQIDKVIVIDQSPIGRTPRSNPATYTDAYGPIRELFAKTTEARARGFRPGRFSFNVKGGRCEACQGNGVIKVEMHFLPDVYVPCDVCHGHRFNEATLDVRYKGSTIADVLRMTVEEALAVFAPIPALQAKLRTLADVGLGYLELGQPATTLSGGEAQRVKLAAELSKVATGRTLYLLDEPTSGLHFADIAKLLDVLHALVNRGNTMLIIEHNLDVIKTADYVIDLGPEGGDRGGALVACGTPEEVAQTPASHTGQELRKLLPAPAAHVRTGSKVRSADA